MTHEKQNPDPVYPFMCGVATGYAALFFGLLLMLGCSGDAGNNLLPPTDAGDAASQEGGGKDGQGGDVRGSDGGGGESTTDASAEPGKESGAEASMEGGGLPGDVVRLPVPATTLGTMSVSAFVLDRDEVSVRRFRKFLDDYKKPAVGSGAHFKYPESGWKASFPLPAMAADVKKAIGGMTYSTWTGTSGGNEDRPANFVTWYEAFAFCVWDGGRLPSLREWQTAAFGGDEGRPYPWGKEYPDASRASYDCLGDTTTPVPHACTISDIRTSGSYPAGRARWGHNDMAGNVMEWVLDDATKPLPACAADCLTPVTDPSSKAWAMNTSFEQSVDYLSSGKARAYYLNQRSYSTGFRCAR